MASVYALLIMEFISLAVRIKYQINSHAKPLTIIHSNDTLDRTSVAPTLMIEGVSRCPTPTRHQQL
jgi:hypothetical protein